MGIGHRARQGSKYSLEASPSGRRRPLVGHRYHPSGIPVPSHFAAAATAASRELYQYPSSYMPEPETPIVTRWFPNSIGVTQISRPSGSSRR